MNILQKPLPIANIVEIITNWVTKTFSGLFDVVQVIGNAIMSFVTNTLIFIIVIKILH